MNIISNKSVTLKDKKVLFSDIVSVFTSKKNISIIDINGEMLNIADEKMIKKFNEKLAEKSNFVYFENRYINADLVKSIKVVTNMANKIYDVEVDFGGRKEIFSNDSESAASIKKKDLISVINKSKEANAGLTK